MVKNIKVGDTLRHIDSGRIVEICNEMDILGVGNPLFWERLSADEVEVEDLPSFYDGLSRMAMIVFLIIVFAALLREILA